MPKVSVIMPSYNSGRYIEQAINSVLHQSYRDLELLIIDDGSTDNSLKIIRERARQDQRIRLLFTNNQGSGAARNKGLDNARGDYYCFIDSDDYYNLDFLAKGMAKVSQGADCVVCNHRRVKGGRSTVYTVKPTPLECHCAVWSKLYAKHCWDRLRFPETLKIEDFEVVPIAVARAERIGYLDDTYYNYRVHANSITHNINLNEAVEAVEAVKLLFANQEKYGVRFGQQALKSYTNDFLYTHLFTTVSRFKGVKQKRAAYRVITAYGKWMNAYYFKSGDVLYNANRLKQYRNDVLIGLFNLNLFSTGIFLAELLAKTFGKQGIK